MPLRLDGRLSLVVVLTSYCIFWCSCVCVLLYYDFSVNQKKHLSAPLCTTAFSIGAIEHCVPAVLCRFLGHQQMWKGKERAAARARDEWETRGEQNWGFLWSPLSRSEERSGDQSGLFYVAGATLWSPRVTYSTHFIKFTSVLIADQ